MSIRRIGLGLAFTLVLASLAAAAQPSTTIPRIGLLADATSWEPLRLGLRDLGYEEGKNIAIEERSTQGQSERFSGLASELVRLNANIIVTWGTPATLAACGIRYFSIGLTLANLVPASAALLSHDHPP